MKTQVRRQLLCLIAFAAAAVAVPATLAQGPWPEKARNLKVLPADTSAQQLRQYMTGFTAALGVRCEHCHVGEADAPLETFDFVADTNPNKDIARAMLTMVRTINTDHMQPLGTATEVDCLSCHRGQPVPPRPLAEVIEEAVSAGGVEAVETTYRRLKDEHYGGIVYDFRAGSLTSLAQSLFQAGKRDEALAIARLNLETNPNSVDALMISAQIQMRTGDTEGALANLRKAAELDPENRQVQGLLRRLERQPPQ